MRPPADQDAVAARAVVRVAHDGAHVVLVADVHQDAGAEPVGSHQIQRGGRRIGAAELRPLGDGAADRGLELGIGDPRDLDGRPVDGLAVRTVGAGHLERFADPLARVGVVEQQQRRIRPARVRPPRQQRGERRRAGQVRVGVERDVGAGGERVVDEREQLGGTAAVRGEVHGRVGEVHGAARCAARCRSPRRTRRARPGRSRACAAPSIRRARRRRRRAPRARPCSRTSRACRSGRSTCPAAPAARPSASSPRIRSSSAAVAGRSSLSDGQQPQVALRHEERGVGAERAGLEPREQPGDVAPGEGIVVEVAVPSGDLPAHERERRVVDRGVGDPVLPDHLRRDALRELGELRRVGERARGRRARACR